jgi:hypothetical protein
MRRRAFLATALTATSTIIAGCGSTDSRTEHTNPTVTHDDHDNAKYLEFYADNTELTIVGVDPNINATPGSLFVSVSHPENTRLRRLTQRFVTPDSDGAQLRLSVQPPGDSDSPNPPISLSQDERVAVVEVEDFGALADESVFITLTISHWPESARGLVVENTVELTRTETPDYTHVLNGQLEFSVVADIRANDSTANPALNSNYQAYYS